MIERENTRAVQYPNVARSFACVSECVVHVWAQFLSIRVYGMPHSKCMCVSYFNISFESLQWLLVGARAHLSTTLCVYRSLWYSLLFMCL